MIHRGSLVRLAILAALAVWAVLLACGDSLMSGSSGLVPRPDVNLAGSWTGTWEFRTCNAGSRYLQECSSDAECDGIVGACAAPATMCDGGAHKARACDPSNVDCPGELLDHDENWRTPKILGPEGQCVSSNLSGTLQLTLIQRAGLPAGNGDWSSRVEGTSLFNGSTCWQAYQWDRDHEDYGNNDAEDPPWQPPVFTADLIGAQISDGNGFMLQGMLLGAKRVPNQGFAKVDLTALGDRMVGTFYVPKVEPVIAEVCRYNDACPYDRGLGSEVRGCEGRRGVLSITRN